MTVQELIDMLEKVEDKSVQVRYQPDGSVELGYVIEVVEMSLDRWHLILKS